MKHIILLTIAFFVTSTGLAQDACMDIFDARPKESKEYYLRVSNQSYAILDPADGRPGATLAIKGKLCHPNKTPASRETVNVYIYTDSSNYENGQMDFNPADCRLERNCRILRHFTTETDARGRFTVIGAPTVGPQNTQTRLAFSANIGSPQYSLFNITLAAGPALIPRHSGK